MESQFEQATIIFFAGIVGVFLGMVMIYAAIRITGLFADRITAKKEAS